MRDIKAHRLYGTFHHSIGVLFVVVFREERAVLIKLIKLRVGVADVLLGVFRELCGEVCGTFLRHRSVDMIEHIIRAVVHDMNAVAVYVEHDIVPELFEFMYHR